MRICSLLKPWVVFSNSKHLTRTERGLDSVQRKRQSWKGREKHGDGKIGGGKSEHVRDKRRKEMYVEKTVDKHEGNVD